MTSRTTVGLLPLYLALYDEIRPEARNEFTPLLKTVVDGMRAEGVDMVQADICRVRGEFEQAMSLFEREKVDAIVTLHLAYSPSLEAIDALAAARTPIVVLDTTMDARFDQQVEPARLMYNHGIHGVMDLCTMLRQRGVAYGVVAGHVTQSDAVSRAAWLCKAAYAARLLRTTKAVRLGRAFESMGDFAVPEKTLQKALGIDVQQCHVTDFAGDVESVDGEAIEAELQADRERFRIDADEAVHRRSVRVGLGLRRFLARQNATAFSFNFQSFTSIDPPIDTVPFLEASKAMSRGIGYAGEGDVFTASLVGALGSAMGETTFTEIFCPDWQGDSLFISHMGEINPDIAADKPRLFEKPYPFSPTNNPAVVTCAPRPGPAVLVNLSPGPDEAFRLIAAPMDVLEDSPQPAMQDSIRGWLRPKCGTASFLEQYSAAGGTHHKALMLGERLEAIRAFAAYAGLEFCEISHA